MPIEGKKSLTLYSGTIRKLGKAKKYGETWDEYLLYLLYKSGRVEGYADERGSKSLTWTAQDAENLSDEQEEYRGKRGIPMER